MPAFRFLLGIQFEYLITISAIRMIGKKAEKEVHTSAASLLLTDRKLEFNHFPSNRRC